MAPSKASKGTPAKPRDGAGIQKARSIVLFCTGGSSEGWIASLGWRPAVAHAVVIAVACLAFANSLEGALMYDDEGERCVACCTCRSRMRGRGHYEER